MCGLTGGGRWERSRGGGVSRGGVRTVGGDGDVGGSHYLMYLAQQDVVRFPSTRDIRCDGVLRLKAMFETQYEACTCVGGEDDQLGRELRRFVYRLGRMVYRE